jgi:arginase
MNSVHIIGVPLDLGGGRRGVDMGPSAFRIAGLGARLVALGYTVTDRGDLAVPIRETLSARDERKKYIDDIARVCTELYERARVAFDAGAKPLVLPPPRPPGRVTRAACRSGCCGWTRTAT